MSISAQPSACQHLAKSTPHLCGQTSAAVPCVRAVAGAKPLAHDATIGFIGIGTMGEPMARCLMQGGRNLLVWNRNAARTASLVADGAVAADFVSDVFARSKIIFLMLSNGAADVVLARGTAQFAHYVRDRTIVYLGTTSPEYSAVLERDIVAAGGRYVEAPVSGSRGPATHANLVTMIAGSRDAIEQISPLLKMFSKDVLYCGEVPRATEMKLAVNLCMIGLVTSLAESVAFASRHGLDLDTFARVLGSGPMSSEILRAKTAKLIARDHSTEACVDVIADNLHLINHAAAEVNAPSRIVAACLSWFEQAQAAGLGKADLTAVCELMRAGDDANSE
jgi:3-hydroxyisobutyrate dehydrogenase